MLHASHRPCGDSERVTRGVLVALIAIAAFGFVFALMPSPQAAARGDVRLEGVRLALYPAADPNARWTFSADEVLYNPDTRESTVMRPRDGRRLVNGELDLTLDADQVTIDGADNLRTPQATIFIPKGCYLMRLGQPGATPVFIDQNAGYRAPYVDIRSTNYHQIGVNFSASFDLADFSIDNRSLRIEDGGSETCDDVKKARAAR